MTTADSIKSALLSAHARPQVAIAYQEKAATEWRLAHEWSDMDVQRASARHYRMARLASGFDESTEPAYA